MFRGRYQHTVDPKGRLSIPAKFRDVLAGYEGPLVVVPNEIALEVYPFQEWERQERRISEQSQFNAEGTANFGDELRAQQRMPAQQKKIVIDAHFAKIQ